MGKDHEMDRLEKENLLGILCMVAGMFFISISDAASKILMEADYHPLQVMALVSWMIAVALMVSSVIHRKSLKEGAVHFKTDHTKWHMVRGALSMATGVCFLFSLKYFKLVDVTIIFFAAPIFMTVLSVIFLKEKVGIFRWGAVCAGFLGVAVALQPDISLLNWKIILPLGGSLTYAIRAVLVRRMRGVETATQIVFHTRLWVGIFCTIPMILFWQDMPLSDFGLFSCVAVLLMMAHLFITKSQVTAPLSVIGPFEYTALIWTATLGYIIWGDLPSVAMMAGAVFIIGAGILIMIREARQKKMQRA